MWSCLMHCLASAGPSGCTALADAVVEDLTNLLKQPVLDGLSGPLKIVLIKAVATIALQRVQYLDRVLRGFMAAASKLAQKVCILHKSHQIPCCILGGVLQC